MECGKRRTAARGGLSSKAGATRGLRGLRGVRAAARGPAATPGVQILDARLVRAHGMHRRRDPRAARARPDRAVVAPGGPIPGLAPPLLDGAPMPASPATDHARREHAPGRDARILFYSHDSYGLGHLRRSLTLASRIAEDLPGASILVASGSPCATHFVLPDGVDVIKLPSVTKDDGGAYVPRTLPGPLEPVLRLRRMLLAGLVRDFLPQVLIVDHQVVGLRGELDLALAAARRLGVHTILGLRDVIDEPAVVAREWSEPRVRAALESAYDRVCVYGCEDVFDPRLEYGFPDGLAGRVRFMGYVVRPAPPRALAPLPPDRPQVLVTTGGGEDGASRIEAYLEGLRPGGAAWDSTIVLGPLLDPARARSIKRAARHLEGVEVHSFHADLPRLLGEMDAVVAMAGYNTTAEILQSGVPAVLLPRVFPRREQLLRAERLEALGLAQCLADPQPSGIRAAVERALDGAGHAPARPRLDGAARLAEVVRELVGSAPADAPTRSGEAVLS